jgi:hypothetical protein
MHTDPERFEELADQYSTHADFCRQMAENPTLAIVTLAIRQAEYIADQMKARAI